jgi:hypothetical protein
MTLDDVYSELLELVSPFGAQLTAPIEAEEFFGREVESFAGSRESLLDHIRTNLPDWFRAVGDRPRWIQEAEWQFSGGKPMVFVGQIDVPAGKSVYHDDASFFVFVDPASGETKTVIQVA